MRSRTKLAFLFPSVALVATSRAQVVQLTWTSDLSNTNGPYTLGPDGPWQAIAVSVGKTLNRNTSSGTNAFDDSPSATKLQFYSGDPPQWFVYKTTTAGGLNSYGYFESILLQPLTSNPIAVNDSILVMNESAFIRADGRIIPNEVGILGLGPKSLKVFGNITSSSFGMHMGSAQHNQSGPLILGGYERNRALGGPGIFKIDDSSLVNMFLVEVLLDTQIGGSPFNQSTIGSIYQGIGDNSYAAELVKLQGGARGSALVTPSPSVPPLYLPPGTCETASQYLPVVWDEDLELYLWNESHPQYSIIVKSSTYLAIVLADSDARNITVKVPFQLLNLTLSPPLVDDPQPYFPCGPLTTELDSTTVTSWPLGRAFLQAAFYGVNYDTQTVFIAQGPGPDITAGVVVASIIGGLGIFGVSIIFWRRNKRQTKDSTHSETHDFSQHISDVVRELDANLAIVGKSDPLPHEMAAPNVVHEAPSAHAHEPICYELPTNNLPDAQH
ncbi:hypothetical protein GGR58DRAFT_503439 [Xylaria digitata]|nr:hypothetical protein GGR58DRAFT_503439 [Xylaria digitata]